MDGIQIRPLRNWDERYAAVELQRVAWGDHIESVIPAHMLHVLARYGGHVLGAFDGSQLVGVVVGFLGTDAEEPHRPAMANLVMASKRICVAPAYRGQGIAYRLKLAQRDMAIRQGVRLVLWTFDPVIARNAYLNIRKLGAVCKQFILDYYGTEPPYATLGTSDRLVAEWWVTHRRVEERLNGRRSDLTLHHYLDANTRIVNPTTTDSIANPCPPDQITTADSSLALLEIPLDFQRILDTDPSLARAWRAHVRDALQLLTNNGYVVTDFLREDYEGRDRAFYVLSWGRDAGASAQYPHIQLEVN